MARFPNRLLASLSSQVLAAIKPHLKAVEFGLGDVLAEAGGKVRRVYFPHSAVVSLVVELNTGEMIETAMVGCDGLVNGSSALDGKVSLNKGIVLLAGVGSAIEVDRFRKIARQAASFRSLLIRHEQVLFAEAQQSAACNASHSIEARMCRWLLRMRDFTESNDLLLTQELLAQMLGVHRPSVSLVAHTLQQGGLIKYNRGTIRLLDIQRLREGSCECYGIVKAHYRRLLSA